MKKGHCGKMLLLFGAACMLMTGCGTKESSKMDTKDMTTRDAEFHTELFGENTYIFSPEDDPGQVAQTLDAIYEKQEADQFGEARYAIYLCRESMTRRSRRMLGFIHRWQGLENFRLTQNYRACNVPQDGFRTIRRITMRAAISGAEWKTSS